MPQDPRLQAVLDIARTVGSTLDLDELLASTMETVTRVVGCDRSTLYLVDPRSGELWSRVAQGAGALEIRLAPGTGIAGWVTHHAQSIVLLDAYTDPRFSRRWDEDTGYRTRTLLSVPFRNASDQVVGVVQCLNKVGSPFTDEDRELLETIGGQCAVAVQNAYLYRSLTERSAELHHANEELQILVEVERAVGGARDELSVLMEGLGQLVGQVGARGAAALILWRGSARLVSVRPGLEPSVDLVPLEVATRHMLRCKAARALGAGEALIAGLPSEGLEVPLRTDAGFMGLVQLIHPHSGYAGGGRRLLTLVAARLSRAVLTRRDLAVHERSERLGLVGQMMSGILHDLRTPMSAVSGYVELMSEESEADQRAYFATRIGVALTHMEEMTHQILQFTRGTNDLVLTEVTLAEFVDDAQAMLRPELQAMGLTLRVLGDLDRRVRLDVGKMRRVLFNLARNAGQAGACTLTWRLDMRGERFVQTLHDDGPGLPEALRGRLFQPFATHGKSGGTGLGLAMVKGIVEAHGGQIDAVSKPGDGTTFILDLPRSPRTGTPASRSVL